MSFDSLIKSRIAAHLAGETRLQRRRRAQERRRKRQGAPHRIDYFHDVADPYAHLTAQVLRALQDRYRIELRPHLISGPPDWAAPARGPLQSYSRADAARLAARAGLDFPADVEPPAPESIARARALVAGALECPGFAEVAVATGAALWKSSPFPTVTETDPSRVVADGDRRLARLGHYLGATFHYGGEWYWGIDRLHYLESRLRELGAALPGAPDGPIHPPPTPRPPAPAREGAVVEAFISFRSPYTYLAFDRVRELAHARNAELHVRPVLPMVMRGLAVPRRKSMYILQDAAREARRLDIPFGRICDPLGKAVERGYALIAPARSAGLLEPYVSSFLRGVWADGIDARTDSGLARIAERAGLDWAEARDHLQNEDWRAEVEANRRELTAMDLWGVPSFRCADTAIWGQDRLWLLEDLLTPSS